ncbi:hypothetical protein G6M87_10940 [Rhizobium rhizogenes]|uniref:hypothetical protein n=1 Tax=Rhizobium rhizogenes TaxID=359 RepID=UPI00157316F6|nr:hypothetical protein [Rhizobium rhizogenes]NTI22373.1 hypothetical protein [Rhizobium rhizogenes]QTG05959.1 hypothetical protein G6M87_10940 [Rhizobium rhizogenes]
MTLVWPRNILPPQTPRPHFLSHMNISGPVSNTGEADIISGDAGFWRASYNSIVVNNAQRVKVWRAIRALLQGRLNPILVPYCHKYQPLVAEYSRAIIPHDSGAYFDTGAGYVASGTQVLLVADIPEHGVSATVNVIAADTLEPGQVFSLGERLFEITKVTELTGTLKAISFMPPAREAVRADTELNFTSPVCRMRLATDDAMLIDLDLNRRAFPSLDFVEDLSS